MSGIAPRRLALAAAATGLAVVLSALPAAAAETDDGLWYFDMLNVQAAHDAGFTGEGVTIAVLDGQINPDVATLRDADVQVQDGPACHIDGVPAPPVSTDPAQAAHATNVVSLLVGTGTDDGGIAVKGVAPGATVLFYRITAGADIGCDDAAGVQDYEAAGEAIDAAVAAGADIISSSIDFQGLVGNLDAVIRAQHAGVIFVTALTNYDTVDDIGTWSSYLNGGVSVQGMDSTGAIRTSTAMGDPEPVQSDNVDVVAAGVGIRVLSEDDWSQHQLGNGTSYATPLVAGFLAVASQKYPEATSNQLIQSLIHNTGVEDHELTYDPEGYYGYGVASLTHMLRVDPTQYPDVNPLLSAESGIPTPEDVAKGTGVATGETPMPDPSTNGPVALPFWLLFLILGIVVVVVCAVVVTVVLLARRRHRGAA